MATKTVINTTPPAAAVAMATSNMPKARGISIIIDKDQQQDVVNCKQQLDVIPKIIVHNQTNANTAFVPTAAIKTTTTTTTTTTTMIQKIPFEMSTLQRSSSAISEKSPLTSTTTTTTTLIGINNMNKSNNQNDHDFNDDYIVTKETGYTTTPMSTSFSQLLLKTATVEPVSMPSPTSDGGKFTTTTTKTNNDGAAAAAAAASAAVIAIGKPHKQTQNDHVNGGGGGVSITHEYSNGTCASSDHVAINKNNNNNNDSSSNKLMIIKCNENDYENNNDHDDNYEQEKQSKYNKESCHSISITGTLNGSGANDANGQQTSFDSISQYGEQQNQQQQQQQMENVSMTAVSLNSLTTKADCASSAPVTEKVGYAEKDSSSHVVKIQIKPKIAENIFNTEKQVTVVQLNDSVDPNESRNCAAIVKNLNCEQNNSSFEKMVQKTSPSATMSSSSNIVGSANSSSGNVNNNIHTGNTTVTEVNVSNPSYLYYMMSSGQFSPCDTLDSGTGSDLESNSNGNGTAVTAAETGAAIATGAASTATSLITNRNEKNGEKAAAPKLEIHLKTTKVRVNNTNHSPSDHNNQSDETHDPRSGSLTDSEESESSSLSCDSLHSSEYLHPPSISPSNKTPTLTSPKMLASFLPDSLLRDIRDRKFPTNDFEMKYGNGTTNSLDVVNEQDYIVETQEATNHIKFIQEHNLTNNNNNNISAASEAMGSTSVTKRASLPSKTFVLNAEDGTFVDTKMNSMPRKYDADKYYNFHVNEHDNFRTFGNNNATIDGCCAANSSDGGDSLSEYDTRSIHDDAFAGYKDIRCGSATSTIRSSKGTVRGVKNRVRNGIATFLQMQQPNVKSFMEKDLGKVVLYTTSMGIIRDTYAKCSNVKQILRTLLVKFEERDIFMSVEYQQEIKERMHSEVIKVPQLFVEGQHIGDADTVERLNESGELRQLLKPYKSISTTYTCQTCGGYRLLPCPSCNGSKKSVHRNHFTAEFVALKCMNCDEVGLVKCHNC